MITTPAAAVATEPCTLRERKTEAPSSGIATLASSDASTFRPAAIGRVMNAVAQTLTALVTKTATARTIAFAASATDRRGTAANDERIMPVPYSPVTTRAPITATISDESIVPLVL